MAAVNQSILSLFPGHPLYIINVSRDLNSNNLFGYVHKAWQILIGSLRILTLRLARPMSYYASVDDGLGGLLGTIPTLAARMRRGRITLHHHSFKYIIRRSLIMRALVWVAGDRATHVFLCDRMEDLFRTQYPGGFSTKISPNCVTDQSLIEYMRSPPRPVCQPVFTIGFLSNLILEKGIDQFFEVLRRSDEVGLELRGVVAGAAFSQPVREYIAQTKRLLGDRLHLVGLVSDREKCAFFESIDVLLLPTRYAAEALPLVLIEALIAGCPIITFDRGCIGLFSRLKAARVLPSDSDFATETYRILKEWTSSPREFSAVKVQAHQEGVALHQAHLDARNSLVDHIIYARAPICESSSNDP